MTWIAAGVERRHAQATAFAVRRADGHLQQNFADFQ